MRIMVILGSARKGRRGEKVARLVERHLQSRNDITVDSVDAATLNLPFYDEPKDPFALNGKYENPAGKAWAERVGQADAYILVTAEYNHGYTALMKNTLDWVGPEWSGKPVDFVSYSNGRIGGARAVQQLRQVVIKLGMLPLSAAAHISNIDESVTDDAKATDPGLDSAIERLIDKLVLYAQKLGA